MEQMKSLLEMMEKLPSEVNVDAVFGTPEKYDDMLLSQWLKYLWLWDWIWFCRRKLWRSAEGCCWNRGKTMTNLTRPPSDCRKKVVMRLAVGVASGPKRARSPILRLDPKVPRLKLLLMTRKLLLTGILLSPGQLGGLDWC